MHVKSNQYSNKFYHEQKAGISDYKQRIESISQSLQKVYAAHERYYASVGAMSTKYWNQVINSSVPGIASHACLRMPLSSSRYCSL